MKRASKWIVLAIALTFLFAMAVPAMAATQDTAAAKLKALGILEGDQNGDLKLGDTITRAEFAKIAVVASGNKDAATLLADTPSQFSDVKGGAWYTGWINLAAAKGYVKGDPQGTFRPNDQISNAEVVTVLLRLLGFNDNLEGNWPLDYLVQAASLGITSDVSSFNATKAAVRGDVAILASATLDEDMVLWSKDNDRFENDGAATTLLAENFDNGNMIEKAVVKEVAVNNDGEMVLKLSNHADLDVLDEVVISGSDNLFGLVGKSANILKVKKSGVDKASYIEVLSYQTVFGAATVENGKIEISSNKYELADNYYYYVDKVASLTDADADGLWGEVTADDTAILAAVDDQDISISLNKDGDIVYIARTTVASQVADSVDAVDGDIEYIGGGSVRNVIKDEQDYAIVKDGKTAGFNDIAKYDVVYDYANLYGYDHYFEVYSNTVEGNLGMLKSGNTDAYINNKKYDIVGGAVVRNNGKTAAITSLVGGDVTAYLDANGDARVILGSKAEATTLNGVLMEASNDTVQGVTTYWVKLFNLGENDEIVYTVNKTYRKDNLITGDDLSKVIGGASFGGAAADFRKGTVVEFTLNSNGEIDSIENLSDTATKFDTDDDVAIGTPITKYDRLTADAAWRYLTDSTVIVNLDASANITVTDGTADLSGIDIDPVLVKWSDIEDATTPDLDIYYKDNDLKYVVIRNTGFASSNEGIYVTKFYDGKNKVQFYDGEAVVDYEANPSLAADVVYTYDMSGSTASNFAVAGSQTIGVVADDGLDLDNQVITVEYADGTTDTFLVDNDTKIADASGSSVSGIELADLQDGDAVIVVEGSNDVATWVVLLKDSDYEVVSAEYVSNVADTNIVVDADGVEVPSVPADDTTYSLYIAEADNLFVAPAVGTTIKLAIYKDKVFTAY